MSSESSKGEMYENLSTKLFMCGIGEETSMSCVLEFQSEHQCHCRCTLNVHKVSSLADKHPLHYLNCQVDFTHYLGFNS